MPERCTKILYCARGDMENRIKEQQLALFADRTSTATMRASSMFGVVPLGINQRGHAR